jgi:hypothetical protein
MTTVLAVLAETCEKAAQYLGPQLAVGLHAMLRYIQSSMLACLDEPLKV